MKALLITPLFCLAVILNVVGQATPQEMLNKAIYQEEVNGNLEEAMKLFLEIVDENSTNRAVTAEAFYHLGLTNEKLGNKKAIGYYEKVINNFEDQPEFVRIAKERLSQLILIAEKAERTPLTPIFTKIDIPTELSWSVKLSPDGKDLALVSDNKLWKMPLSGKLGKNLPGTPVQVNTEGIEVGWWGLSWSGDGKWIAFNERPLENKKSEIIFLVSSDGGKPKKITNPNRYTSEPVVNLRLGLSPDGKKLAFSSVDNLKAHVFTTQINGGSTKQLVDFQAREPVFSPDGKMIAFAGEYSGNSEGELGLWVIPVQGGTPHLLADAGDASSPVWSPDGKMIAFLDNSDNKQINIVPVSKNGEITGKVTAINAPDGVSEIRLLAGWTPDNKIGALMTANQKFALYTLPSKGGQAAMVLNDTYALQPRWSSDSKKIYYTVSVDENNQSWQNRGLAVVPAEGGKGTILTRNKDAKIRVPFGYQAGNRVSSDGKIIVSAAKLPNDSDFIKNYPSTQIWKIPIDGSKPIKITNPQEPYTDIGPCWSPDGEKVAFLRLELVEGNGEKIFGEAGGIYIVDSSGGESKLLTSTSGKYVNSLVWSSDGKMIAYITADKEGKTPNAINVIDVSNSESKVVGEVHVANVNIELAWSPDSKRIAFNDGFGKVIKVMSLSDGSIEDIRTGLLDVRIHHLDWSPDGKRFVFGGRSKGGEAEFWLLENFLPLEKLPQKKEKENIVISKFMDGTGSVFYGAPSPDGKYFSFIDYGTYPNDIVIKEIGTGKEIRLRNQTDLNYEGDEGTPYNPLWSPDSKQIAYVWENDKDNFYELRIIEVDNPEPDDLIRVSYFKGWIKTEDWSPDGQHILVQLTQNNQDKLGLVSIVDGSFQQLKKIGKTAPYSAKFSPDGKYVSYDNPPDEENTEHDIFVLQIDGKQENKLTSHPSHDYFLDWSSSGQKILFASDRTGTTDMWSISFDEETTSKDPKLITENIGNIGPLGSTRNGSFYFSTPGSWWDIYTVTIDPQSGKVTAPPIEVPLPYQGYNQYPTWSPDGKYLAYVSVRRHLRKPNILCIYTKQTGSIKEFVYEQDVNHPVWFPDSQSILLFGTDILEIATSELTPYIQLKKDEEVYNIIISSDNEYIYYATRNEDWMTHTIFSRNLETGKDKELYTTTDENLTLALSPDGKQLAVMSLYNENTRILKILSTMEGSEKDIYSFKQEEFGYKSIAWSPDGKYIYFSERTGSEEKRPDELCRIPAAGGDAENLGVNMFLFTNISVHPDGQLITFNSFVGKEKSGGVWVMENFLPED